MVPTINAVPEMKPTRLLRPTMEMLPSEMFRTLSERLLKWLANGLLSEYRIPLPPPPPPPPPSSSSASFSSILATLIAWPSPPLVATVNNNIGYFYQQKKRDSTLHFYSMLTFVIPFPSFPIRSPTHSLCLFLVFTINCIIVSITSLYFAKPTE